MESITSLFNQLGVATQSNPLLAGIVSLYGLTVVGVVFRKVPMAVFGFLRRQFTTTVSLTNESRGTNPQTFSGFMEWFDRSSWSRLSRSAAITGNYYGANQIGTTLGVGYGRHFFLYKGRPCWLNYSLMSNIQSQVTHEIVITMLGRSRERLQEMIDEFRYRPDGNKVGVFVANGKEWVRVADVGRRRLETVVIERKAKEGLVTDIDRWLLARQWHEARGLSYKRTFLLEGPPGTGKTSLIKALASHYGMDVCMINPSLVSDQDLQVLLGSSGRMIVFEDIDSASVARRRHHLPGPGGEAGEGFDSSGAFGVTLSGLLNALDGLVSLDGKLVFLTTNALQSLDPALVRKGRVDRILRLGLLGDGEVRDYIELMFPGHRVDPALEFAPISGCDLQALYFQHATCAGDFVAAIPHRPAIRLQRPSLEMVG